MIHYFDLISLQLCPGDTVEARPSNVLLSHSTLQERDTVWGFRFSSS